MEISNHSITINVIFQIGWIEGFEPFNPAVLVWGGTEQLIHKEMVYLPFPSFSTKVKADSIEFIVSNPVMESFLGISDKKSKQIKGKFKILTNKGGESKWNKFDATIKGSQ